MYAGDKHHHNFRQEVLPVGSIALVQQVNWKTRPYGHARLLCVKCVLPRIPALRYIPEEH
ncbi:hypothetical protein E2C01_020297 [Portunus trituberculatus]|uniref:Uncharacterized protein n=1 Tax=Portunus trituberculatus TaxID=210409 RepID=A0A5B7E0X2_PORTR|nr:hypothetical protein [Portunus trituberculatus]